MLGQCHFIAAICWSGGLALSVFASHLWRMLRGLRNCRTGFAQVLMTLAFVAIAFRALVPPGYMVAPSRSGQGAIVVLCSGAGPAYLDPATGEVVHGEQPAQPKDDSKSAGNTPCIFAASAQWGPPAHAPLPPIARAVSHEAPRTVRATVLALGAAAPTPWSTGPPLSA